MKALFVALATLLPAAALADAPARSAPSRTGITAGLSLGAGVIASSCEGCDSLAGPAVEFHLGWGLSQRFALVYEGSAVAHTGDGFGSEMSMVLAGAVQYWVLPRMWLRAGIGVAQLELREGVFGQNESSFSALGLVAGAGYELYSAGRFVFDVHARVTTGFYEDNRVTNGSVVIGVNWY